LRQDLREGVHPPGARLAATEIAEGLGLSATPVREALSRLAGEGLLEDRRGQGFFVRVLTGADVADLWRLSLAQLAMAQDARRPPVPRSGLDSPITGAGSEDDPVRRVERLFAAWVAEGGGRALGLVHRAVQGQLGQVRRVERVIFRDLGEEAAALAALSPMDRRGERVAALRRFHRRRIAAAGRLAVLLQARAPGLNYGGDIV
jgi:hypothetical protein